MTIYFFSFLFCGELYVPHLRSVMQNLTQEQIEAAALQEAIIDERKYILGDMPTEEFIDMYVHIENKDNLGEPIIKFDMWEAQRTALREMEDNRLNIILKARQLGFTWLVLSMLVRYTLKYDGFRAICVSETDDKSKDLINRCELIMSKLPVWLIISEKKLKEYERFHGRGSYKGLYYRKSVHDIQVIRAGGEITQTATIEAQPSTEGAGRGLTADVVFFDEWAFHRFAEDVFVAAYPTMARPTSGKFIGLSTNNRGSLYEDVWRHAADRGFHTIFRNCFADPRRDEQWYEETAATLRGKMQQEFPRTEEEALIAGENVSFPEFAEAIHVCEPFEIPEHWRRWASVDNGYNDPYAWYKYAVDEDGTVYVYYEQSRWREEQQVIYSAQAEQFKNSLLYLGSDGTYKLEKIDYIVAGLDAWNTHHRDRSGKNLIDYYRDGGLTHIGFTQAVTDQKLRKATLHEYLKPYKDENTGKVTAKLQIFSSCKYLISTLPQLVNDDKRPEIVADLSDINNCLVGDTLIRTTEGLKRIKDLVGRDGKLFSYDIATGKVVIRNYSDARMTKENATIYEVELEDGSIIRGTWNHPVLTEDGWKCLIDLTVEDELIEAEDYMRAKKNPEYTEYDGQRFAKDKKSGYYRSSQKINGKQVLLHRYVWEKYNGPIPKDCSIHHIDGNKDNNSIENLKLLSTSEHSSMHTKDRIAENPKQYAEDFVARTNDKAKVWHKSEAGKEWHRMHAKSSIIPAMRKTVGKVCKCCGKNYEASAPTAYRSKFCSRKCKAKARRQSGIDNVEKQCPVCGYMFTTNRYDNSRTCSHECAGVLRRTDICE